MNKAVIGIVQSGDQAQNIVSELHDQGFPLANVSVLLPNREGSHDFAYEQHTKAPEGTVVGVSAGGVVGSVLGLLAGIGAFVIPGVGVFVAAGPLMGALSGAAAGAAAGGVTGALVGMGIPELEAKTYEGKVKDGNVLLAVHTETSEQQKEAQAVLRRMGAEDVTSTREASVPKDRRRDVTAHPHR